MLTSPFETSLTSPLLVNPSPSFSTDHDGTSIPFDKAIQLLKEQRVQITEDPSGETVLTFIPTFAATTTTSTITTTTTATSTVMSSKVVSVL